MDNVGKKRLENGHLGLTYFVLHYKIFPCVLLT